MRSAAACSGLVVVPDLPAFCGGHRRVPARERSVAVWSGRGCVADQRLGKVDGNPMRCQELVRGCGARVGSREVRGYLLSS